MELTYSKIQGRDWTIRMNDGSGDELAYVEFSVDLEEEEISPLPVNLQNPI